MNHAPTDKKALIIAGPVTAMALQRAGIDPVVYEAYDTSAGLDAGAFLTVAVNGLDGLRVLDAHEPVLDAGFPTRNIEFFSGTGKRLGEAPSAGRCQMARSPTLSSALTCIRRSGCSAGVRRLRAAPARTRRRAGGAVQQRQSRRTHRPGAARHHAARDPQARRQQRREISRVDVRLPRRLGREARELADPLGAVSRVPDRADELTLTNRGNLRSPAPPQPPAPPDARRDAPRGANSARSRTPPPSARL